MNNYIKKFINMLINLIIMKFHKSKFINDKLSLYLENFILFCKNKNLKFYYNKKDKDYYLVENNRKIFFSNKIRGFNLYRESTNIP